MEIFMAIYKGALAVVFVVSVLCTVLMVVALVFTGFLGLVTKEYKYFKIVFKIAGYVLATLIGSILLYAVTIFLEHTLAG